MAVNRMFRTCPATGLRFHQPAEALMKINAVAGVVFLLLGGLLAIGVTLTRWQAVHLLPADWFNYERAAEVRLEPGQLLTIDFSAAKGGVLFL